MNAPVTIVQILPTRIWIESGMCGERVVVMQHEGMHPFDYAIFNYDYAYTSNSGTHAAAESLAISLGAVEPIEHKARTTSRPSLGELRDAIVELQAELALEETTSEDTP